MLTQPELAARAIRLMQSVRDRRKSLGVAAPLNIVCGNHKPKFRLRLDGVFVHANSNRKVTFRRLGEQDLTSICDQASTYLRVTAQ